MKRLSLYLVITLGLGAFPVGLNAAFYDEATKMPTVESLTFGTNYVGIQIARYDFGRYPLPPLVHSRSNNKMDPVSKDRFFSIFGDNIELRPNPMRPQEITYETTNGTPYTPNICDAYDQVVTSKMTIGDEPFDIEFGECVSVSEVEIIGDLVWIATYYPGTHGFSKAAGLVVASTNSAEILATIDTGPYAAYLVRHDPVTDQIWVVSSDRIVILDQDGSVVAEHFLRYDFNGDSGTPEIQISETLRESHPMAVFATHLPPTHHKPFYEAVQTIPNDIARAFSLYDFYMCCSFRQPGQPSRRPKEHEILVPFLLPAFRKDLERWKQHGRSGSKSASRMWRQVACNHRDNEEAALLCDTEDWAVLIEAQ